MNYNYATIILPSFWKQNNVIQNAHDYASFDTYETKIFFPDKNRTDDFYNFHLKFDKFAIEGRGLFINALKEYDKYDDLKNFLTKKITDEIIHDVEPCIKVLDALSTLSEKEKIQDNVQFEKESYDYFNVSDYSYSKIFDNFALLNKNIISPKHLKSDITGLLNMASKVVGSENNKSGYVIGETLKEALERAVEIYTFDIDKIKNILA